MPSAADNLEGVEKILTFPESSVPEGSAKPPSGKRKGRPENSSYRGKRSDCGLEALNPKKCFVA